MGIISLHGNDGLNKFFILVGEEWKGWTTFLNLIENDPSSFIKKPDQLQNRKQNNKCFLQPSQPIINKPSQKPENLEANIETYHWSSTKRARPSLQRYPSPPSLSYGIQWWPLLRNASTTNDFRDLIPFRVDKAILHCMTKE